MLLACEILGDVGDQRFAGRVVERLRVDSVGARKRRLRTLTNAGTDVAVDLTRLLPWDGAVVVDDGSRIVVVERTRRSSCGSRI